MNRLSSRTSLRHAGRISVPVLFPILLSVFLFILVLFNALTVSASTCNLYSSGAAVPTNYGVPWNPFTTARELLLDSYCNADGSVKHTVGSNAANQYIHNKGYFYGTAWNQFTLSGTLVEGLQAWLMGQGTYTNPLPPATDYFWVGYVCHWQSSTSSWKCGCRDSACTTNHWQLQGVKRESVGGGGSSGSGIKLTWDAASTFSKMQNVNDWFYNYIDSSGLSAALVWNANTSEWNGSGGAVLIGASRMRAASGLTASRDWRAGFGATMRVEGTASIASGSCTNSATVEIRKGGTVLWQKNIVSGTAESHDVSVAVNEGETLNFRVSSPSASCAIVNWAPKITQASDQACWKLAWNDEFNTAARSSYDPTKWRSWDDANLFPGAWNIRKSNAWVEDGTLVLQTAIEDAAQGLYTGGRVDTNGIYEPAGGAGRAIRIEAKTLRTPRVDGNKGDKPAFWTVGGADATAAYWWDPTKANTPVSGGVRQLQTKAHFSNVQGGNNWRYQYRQSNGSYADMQWNSTLGAWQAPGISNLVVGDTYQTPAGGLAAVRTFTAPHPGQLRIGGGTARLTDSNCSAGAKAQIFINDTLKAERTLTPSSSSATFNILREGIPPGGRVRFAVTPNSANCGTTEWQPWIEYTPWPGIGEMDIMEYFPHVKPHVGPHTAARGFLIGTAVEVNPGPSELNENEWIVSDVEWYSDKLDFHFGNALPGQNKSQLKLRYDYNDTIDEWPFDKGQIIILANFIKNGSGIPTSFPTYMWTDYVRVWENTCGL